MPSPLTKRQSKAKQAIHEQTLAARGLRQSKLKADRGLSAALGRPVGGSGLARRTIGRPGSKSKDNSQ